MSFETLFGETRFYDKRRQQQRRSRGWAPTAAKNGFNPFIKSRLLSVFEHQHSLQLVILAYLGLACFSTLDYSFYPLVQLWSKSFSFLRLPLARI